LQTFQKMQNVVHEERSGLRRDGRMWKITPGVGGLPQAGLRKMSSLSARRCMEIGDHCLTVRMTANELDMNCERVWTIITKDLGMRKICAKMKLQKE